MRVTKNHFAFALYILGCLLGLLWFRHIHASAVTLAIDAAISSGSSFEVYINGNYSEPLRAKVTGPARTTYSFPNAPGTIGTVRLDPTDDKGAEVRIFSFKLLSRNGPIAEIPLKELAAWTILNGQGQLAADPGGEPMLRLRTTAADLIVMGSPGLMLQTDWLAPLSRLFLGMTAPDTMYLVVVLVLTTWLGAAALCWRLPLPLLSAPLLLAATYLLTRFIARWVADWPGAFTSAAHAVGYAAWIPFSYQSEARIVMAGIACVSVCALLIGVILRRGLEVEEQPQAAVSRTSRLLFIATVILIALYLLPQLHLLLASLPGLRHSADYDSQNIVTWQWASWKGWLPYRDFWYPYSGYYVMTLPWPPQGYVLYLNYVLIYSIFFGGSLWFLNFKPLRYLLFLIVAAVGIGTDAFPSWVIARHLMAVDIVFLFAVALSANKKRYYAAHALWTGWTLFAEISQVIYAVPGCALLLLGCLWLRRREKAVLRKTVAGLLVWIAVFAALITALLFLFWRRGQLAGVLRFWASLFKDMIAACAIPADVVGWLTLLPRKENLVFLALLAAFALSVLHFFSVRTRDAAWRLAPLALSTAIAMLFGKHLIRPHMAWQFIALPVLLLLLLFILHITARPLRRGALLTASLIMGFGSALIAGFSGRCFQAVTGQLKGNLLALPANFAVMRQGSAPWQNFGETYFSPAAFTLRGIEGQKLSEMFLAAAPDLPRNEVYVFGDDAYLYIILGKKIAPYISFYNQSALSDQQQTNAWLKTHKPKYVIWDPAFVQFDSVPNIVRVPLVFHEIAHNYVPSAEVGPYQLLERRAEEAPIAWDFWTQRIGTGVDLGFIPAVSGAPKARSEADTGGYTRLFAVVEVPKKTKATRDEFEITAGDIHFRIQYQTHPRVRRYYVQLDRLWFYALARKTGLRPLVAANTKAGWNIRLKRIPLKQAVMY